MDLTTKYLGLTLRTPLIVSACRLSESLDNIKQMEKAGAGAIVMYSIFEEEVRYDDDFSDYMLHLGTDSFAEALTYFPNIENRKSFLNQHLSHLAEAVKAAAVPIIGSLNAVTHEGWLDYAVEMQNTGIGALELNLYNLPVQQQPAEILEKQYIKLIKELKQKLTIPLVVKISPFHTSLKDFIFKLDKVAGVDGVVLFNRFYHPDIDIKTLELKPNIKLSTSYEMRLPMRWIALLKREVNCSLVGSTGVHAAEDLIKYMLVGADAVGCASCLMKNGIDHLKVLLDGLKKWMVGKNCDSMEQVAKLCGQRIVADKVEFERAQYMRALRDFSR